MQGSQILEILAANVKRVRIEMGYSQLKLSELANISPGYMCDIENCRKWPGSNSLAALAQALKLDPYQLLLPSDDSPYFERHSTLTSYTRNLKKVLAESVDNAYEQFLQPYGPRRDEDG